MKNYETGKCYNFWVVGLTGNRLDLEDENGDTFTVPAYDFQIDWDWSSPEVPVEAISCYVKTLAQNGRPILLQNREVLLMVLYQNASNGISENAVFTILEHKILNDILYYIVKDAYGLSHMFKPQQDGNYLLPGYEIELAVTGIRHRDENKSSLMLAYPIQNVSISSTDIEDKAGEFGEEDDFTEFKSTIIYPAGAAAPDIDTQIVVIMRTLAGFMNAQGGTLYIGVNDEGKAIGIEKEYGLLNTSNEDRNIYKCDKDGYQNKIRNSIVHYLKQIAQDYVTISFPESNGHTVCKCSVEPSQMVIWFNERDAYKRTGNRTSHLRCEAINKLVMDKNNIQLANAYTVQPIAIASEDDVNLDEDHVVDVPTVVKVHQPEKLKAIGAQCSGRGSFYMNLFSDGTWSWSKKIPSDADLEYCVPINSPASKHDLIMVYEDGCVNRVDAYHLHSDKKQDKRYANGRRNDGVRLIKAFAAREDDLLGCFSSQDGHPFVKVHSISHVSQRKQMHLKGIVLINTSGHTNVTFEDLCFVSAKHTQRLTSLFKTENQTSTSLGIQMDLPKNSKFLMAEKSLRAVCDVIESE